MTSENVQSEIDGVRECSVRDRWRQRMFSLRKMTSENVQSEIDGIREC